MNKLTSIFIFVIFVAFSIFGVLSLSSLHVSNSGLCVLPALGIDSCPFAITEATAVFHHLNGFQTLSLSIISVIFLLAMSFLVFRILIPAPKIGNIKTYIFQKLNEINYIAHRQTLKALAYIYRLDPDSSSRRTCLVFR